MIVLSSMLVLSTCTDNNGCSYCAVFLLCIKGYYKVYKRVQLLQAFLTFMPEFVTSEMGLKNNHIYNTYNKMFII